eukprot:3971626-Prymnesium_polylepis.1
MREALLRMCSAARVRSFRQTSARCRSMPAASRASLRDAPRWSDVGAPLACGTCCAEGGGVLLALDG